MKIELSRHEVAEIIANHFMNSSQFPDANELEATFIIESNRFGGDTLSCTVEEV